MPAKTLRAAMYSEEDSKEEYSLNMSAIAIKYLKRAYCITNIKTLEKQWNISREKRDDEEIIKLHDIGKKFAEDNFIDLFLIVFCFENYFKGLLIRKGYLVNEIDKKVAEGKFKELGSIFHKPIKYDDYKEIEEAFYDDIRKSYILRGLKTRTLYFSTILYNSDYSNIIGVDSNIIDTLKRINEKRNKLHFKVIDATQFGNEYINDINRIISFANENIIKEYNDFIKKIKEEKDWEKFIIGDITGA